MQQLSLATNTGVDWDSFCREVCEITLMCGSCKIGGREKTVQIDESKHGKQKYQSGHRVKGQWVFGGIEEDSRKCFIFPVSFQSLRNGLLQVHLLSRIAGNRMPGVVNQ